MKKILYQLIFKTISTAVCYLMFITTGNGQNYSLNLLDSPGEVTALSGFVDVVCNNSSGYFVPNNSACISPTCFGNELDGVPLSEYHVMGIGETVNLTITANTNSNYPYTEINVFYYSNIGQSNEQSIALANPLTSCSAPPCSINIPVNFTPTTGSLKGAFCIQLGSLGTYVFPVAVTGPTSQEVPILYSTRTPIIPKTIIYDPPGDGSSSMFNVSTEFCREYSTAVERSTGFSNNTDITLGVSGSVGFVATVDFDFGVTFSGGFGNTKTKTSESTFENCISISQNIETSNLDSNIGASSDLIIGISEWQNYAIGDVVELSGCIPIVDKQLYIWSDPNQATLSVMTEDLILQDISTLQNLIDAGVGATSPEIVTQAQNQIDVWNQVLAQKAASEANATYETTLTFPVGTNIGAEIGFTSTEMSTITYQTVVDANAGLDVFVNIGGTGASNTSEMTWQDTNGQGTSTTIGMSEIMSYNITDDEDVIIADVYRDNVFGTPIVRLNPTSATSCPYEGGTRRDQPRINFSGITCSGNEAKSIDVTDNQDFSSPTMVSLNLCNDSNESRTYQLSTNGTNLNGLMGLLEDDYTVAANACLTLNLFLTGNGSANDSHFIEFLLYPECGGSPVQDEADFAFLNISFQAGATYQAATNCNRLFVDKTATGGNNGTSWNNAFNYLQDAIAAAVSGDTICVAAGIYYPDEGANQTDNDQNASFSMKNGVVILGGFEGTESILFDVNQRDIAANETILSGDIDQVQFWNGNSYQIVYNTNIDNTAVLDGFTISEGGAIFSPTNQDGAGIYNDNASPLIRNCFIHRNLADLGAGMYLVNNSNPVITNCNFMLNLADVVGGAIAIAGSIPTISYCSFSGNQANVNGPAIRVFSTGNINISHSILWGNGTGSGVLNIDILFSGGIGSCNYCIIDADGGGTNPGVGGLNQDPLFVNQPPVNINSTGGDLRLQAGSPAIDFISDPSGPMIDQDGKMRPIGAGHDIGAYEFGTDCPSSFNLTGTLNLAADYETSGILQSTQIISSTINVQYDSGSCIELNSGFEVQLGAQFDAFIDGCGNVLQTEIEQQ